MAALARLLVLILCSCAHARAATAIAAAPPQRSQQQQRLGRETSFWKSAASGGAAACAATVAFHPVDTLKTVLQSGAVGAGGVATVRALGVSGLYRGVLPAALSMMPACAVRMGAYEVLKGALLQHAPRDINPGVLVFCASALSVVASSSVRAPLDMIKTRVQADASITAVSAIRSAWGGGLSSVYRGAGLGLMRDVPFFGCNLLIYEQLKAAASEQKAAAMRARRAAERRRLLLTRGSGGGGESESQAHFGRDLGVEGCCEEGGVEGGGTPTPLLSPLELVLIGAAAQGIAVRRDVSVIEPPHTATHTATHTPLPGLPVWLR